MRHKGQQGAACLDGLDHLRTEGGLVERGGQRRGAEVQHLEHVRLRTWPVFGFGPLGDHPYQRVALFRQRDLAVMLLP